MYYSSQRQPQHLEPAIWAWESHLELLNSVAPIPYIFEVRVLKYFTFQYSAVRLVRHFRGKTIILGVESLS